MLNTRNLANRNNRQLQMIGEKGNSHKLSFSDSDFGMIPVMHSIDKALIQSDEYVHQSAEGGRPNVKNVLRWAK